MTNSKQPRRGGRIIRSSFFCRPIRGWNLFWSPNPRFHRGLLSAASPALNRPAGFQIL